MRENNIGETRDEWTTRVYTSRRMVVLALLYLRIVYLLISKASCISTFLLPFSIKPTNWL